MASDLSTGHQWEGADLTLLVEDSNFAKDFFDGITGFEAWPSDTRGSKSDLHAFVPERICPHISLPEDCLQYYWHCVELESC